MNDALLCMFPKMKSVLENLKQAYRIVQIGQPPGNSLYKLFSVGIEVSSSSIMTQKPV